MMTESELSALLDAHDSLVRACVGSELTFSDFLSAYDDFPHNYRLDEEGVSEEARAVVRRFRQRIAFHLRVSGTLSGLRSVDDSSAVYGGAGSFLPAVGLMRLRELAARYRDFRTE